MLLLWIIYISIIIAIVLRFNPLIRATLDKNTINMDFFDYYSQEMNKY